MSKMQRDTTTGAAGIYTAAPEQAGRKLKKGRNKARGSAFELRVRDALIDGGWFVVKAGASLGAADLVALKKHHSPLLVQCKRRGMRDFGPGERRELFEAAASAGALPLLASPSDTRGVLRWREIVNDAGFPPVDCNAPSALSTKGAA